MNINNKLKIIMGRLDNCMNSDSDFGIINTFYQPSKLYIHFINYTY
jgi:hypothetical protein